MRTSAPVADAVSGLWAPWRETRMGTRYRLAVPPSPSSGTCSRALAAPLIALLAACGATAPAPHMAPPSPAIRTARAEAPTTAVDPQPFLADTPPTELRSAVTPRAAWLDLGASPVSPDGEPRDPVEVILVEPGPTMVRVAVRTPALRYVIWVARADLHGVLAHEVTVAPPTSAGQDGPRATLRRGARIEVVERKGDRARIRYTGGVEIETWTEASAIAEQGELREGGGQVFSGRRLFHIVPGLAIRAEPRWGDNILAVLARTFIVEELRSLDDAWSEVQYIDGAVSVRGFTSRRDPPQRLRGRGPDGSGGGAATAPALAATEQLPPGVCLHASAGGEAIGLTVAAVPAAVDSDDKEGWRAVTVETPWSAMRFFARRDRGAWQPCEPTRR